MKTPIHLIGGPTASGKTALAIRLAKEANGVIINTDAMQVYKGLPLLTAQPTAEEKAEVPHLLYEVLEPSERCSAGRWQVAAERAILSALEEGRTPFLVGGSGLYFRALEGGLANIPPIPEATRETAQRLYEELGEKTFRLRLAEEDPESAAHIKPNDKQRLIRAFEVALATGTPLPTWQRTAAAQSFLSAFPVRRILILPERSALYAATDARFLRMMEEGAEKEVKALLARNLDPTLPAMKILGVSELAAYLKGQITKEEAIQKAQQATRNYAKRQVTWFKNQWSAKPDCEITILRTSEQQISR